MKYTRDDLMEVLRDVRLVYSKLANLSSKFTHLGIDFETRYADILAKKNNEKHFLDQELTYVEALYFRQKELLDSAQKKDKSMRPLSNITDYPMMDCECEILHETLSRLFGALKLLEREHWSFIERFLRERYPVRAKNPLEILSTRFLRFIANLPGKTPQALAHYCDLLRRSTNSNADKEKINTLIRSIITDVALFLNDSITILNESGFDQQHPSYKYIKNLILDFNLSNFSQDKLFPFK